MKKLLLSIFCAAVCISAMAVPAKRGTRVFTQADGSTIHLQLQGDEWNHSFVTDDGMAVQRADNGNFYYRNAQGLTSVVAHDASQRSAQEAQFVAANGAQMTLQSLFTPAKQARRAQNKVARKSSQVPQTGSPRVPVILVQYKDKKFLSSDPVSVWKDEISKPDAVSVYQYFVDQSFGKYTPQFDILGPVTLENNRSTYGGNDYSGNDKGVGRMVGEACLQMDSTVNWSDYDNDGDGVCDVVIVLYAGDGEASSYDIDADNAVWPCQWDLSSSDYGKNLVLDCTTVSKFAVFNEAHGSDLSKIDGIGTFCHEFSHCLDLPDFYETTYANGYFGMGAWSLLDYGSYNNDGYTPCAYTGYERDFMGWVPLEEPTPDSTYTIEAAAAGGKAYKITTDNPDEYYVIENIQQTGWNEYARSSGLQVTHVTYDEYKWNYNRVNNSDEQGMTIIPADNDLKMDAYSYGWQTSYRLNDEDMKGDLYPYNGNDQLTATSTPAATLYKSSQNLDKPITRITKNDDGTVTFTYMKAPAQVPVALEATEITDSTVVATWTPTTDAVSYTLKVAPKPDYTLLYKETFVKCTTNSYFDMSNKLDQYMDNPGWTGSTVYVDKGGIHLGSMYQTGKLVSPALDLTTSRGKCIVVLKGKAYSSDTNCTLTARIGAQTQALSFASSNNEETKILTFDVEESNTRQLTLSTAAGSKRVAITGIDIYSGDATEALNAPARAASETRDEVAGSILIEGITDTTYTVTGLQPGVAYNYMVKAIYENDYSDWSNVITFTTTAPAPLAGDVNLDGVVDVTDVNIVINVMLGKDEAANYDGRADLNGDDVVDITDVNMVINAMLGK